SQSPVRGYKRSPRVVRKNPSKKLSEEDDEDEHDGAGAHPSAETFEEKLKEKWKAASKEGKYVDVRTAEILAVTPELVAKGEYLLDYPNLLAYKQNEKEYYIRALKILGLSSPYAYGVPRSDSLRSRNRVFGSPRSKTSKQKVSDGEEDEDE